MSQHPTQVTLRDENALLFLLLYRVKLHEIKVVGWMDGSNYVPNMCEISLT